MVQRNSFKPKTNEELLRAENFKKEVEAKKNLVIRLASECLADPKFKKYRKEFEDFRRKVFQYMAEPMNPDPAQDAHYLRSCINTVNVLDMLIGKIERDNKNGL